MRYAQKGGCRLNWLGLPPAGYFSRAGKVTKSAPKPRFWNPFPVGKEGFGRTIPITLGPTWASAPTDKRNVSSGGVGGDVHIAPLIGANTPAFRTVSGSGANAEAIPHLRPFAKSPKRVGRTPTILNVRGALRKSRNPGFWRRFCILFAAVGKKCAVGDTETRTGRLYLPTPPNCPITRVRGRPRAARASPYLVRVSL